MFYTRFLLCCNHLLNNLNKMMSETVSFKQWDQLFIEIAWFKYHIITIMFDDNFTGGKITNLIIDDKFKRHINMLMDQLD